MSGHTAQSGIGTPPESTNLRETVREITGYWWFGLVAGIAWLVISLVILQFDSASVTTVGVLVGLPVPSRRRRERRPRDRARRASLGARAL